MIEIPNLEQPSYAQHELEEILEQFEQSTNFDAPPESNLGTTAEATPVEQQDAPFPMQTPQLRSNSVLESPINLYENTASPYVALPQYLNATQSPMAVDSYFSSSKQNYADYTEPSPLGDSNGTPEISDLNNFHIDSPQFSVREGAPESDGLAKQSSVATEDPANLNYDLGNGHIVNEHAHHEPSPSGSNFGADDKIYESTKAFMITSGEEDMSDPARPIDLSVYDREADIEPQELEYNQTPPLHQSSTRMTPHPLKYTFNADQVPEAASFATPRMPSQGENPSLGDPALIPSNNTFSPRIFATPSTANVNRVEPSPQLPPPTSGKAISSLTQSDEFFQVRKYMATESKSPADYTLHILFTQFVRHAERKLNLCVSYPIKQEPPIIDMLAEGVDQQFDNIIRSLGYIAKRKPKPIIDSVMFWRKSKSEVAAMASNEVEKVLSLAQSNLARASAELDPIDSNTLNKSQPLPKAAPGLGKRSLSLMRTKSISKFAHKRNASAAAVPTNNTLKSSKTNGERENEQNEYLRRKSFYEEQTSIAQETAIQAERKSLASIYILCRVLIEIVKQTSLDAWSSELSRKLEEIVYNQLKTTDPVTTSASFVRLANWNIFSELLGVMSEKSFLSVSDRFIADLEKVPINVNHDDEPQIHLLIHGMRYLKLTNYPLEKFEESAEFVQSLTKFFRKAQNHTIVYAYAEVLSGLVLPLASELTAEANHPLWVEATTEMYDKARKLWLTSNSSIQGTTSGSSAPSLGKPGTDSDWEISLSLMTSALVVSSKELFSENWFELIESNASKLKPKIDTHLKTRLMICISRLVWVYINRLSDTLNNTTKKLDRLCDLLFFSPFSGKKQHWITSETSLITPIAETIRIVGFQHSNYVLENVILKLLRSSFNGSNLENFSPEKMMVVIRSYMLCLKDFKSGERPSFPFDDAFENSTNGFYFAEPGKTIKNLFQISRANSFRKWNNLMNKKQIKNYASHEEICRSFSALLKLLDSYCGVQSWTSNDTAYPTPNGSKSFSTLSFSFGLDFYQSSKDVYYNLFATLLDAYTWTVSYLVGEKAGSTSQGSTFQNTIEIFIRNSLHENPSIASAAIVSLAKLASRKNAGTLLTTFSRIAFRMSDKPGSGYNAEYLNSENFIKLMQLYVELLKCWLDQFSEENLAADRLEDNSDNELITNAGLDDLYQINHKASDLTNLEPSNKLKPYEELEWKNTITVIEEVEGNGLFFLCSDDSRVRSFAINILKIVEQFDQSIYNNTESKDTPVTRINTNSSSQKGHSRSSSKYAADEGTRLIHVIENIDLLDLIKPLRKELSVPERTRLSKIKNKKGLLFKFASSDYGIDSTIWFRIFPKLLDILFERCPMPIALCRSIVCVRLVQMHELIVSFSESHRINTSSIFNRSATTIPPEVLVNQWKLYLIFACSSLTTTNEQKISIPTQPTHGRKKSLPMYIQHQKITSAKSVFRMVLPLLKSQQSMVREAVISGLSCININTCRTLTENLPSSLTEWDVDVKRRDPSEDKVRVEAIHILSIITSRFKSNNDLYGDDSTVANFVSIIKNAKAFLSVPTIQTSPEFQRLRFYFSMFLENVFNGLLAKKDLNRWLPFEARIGCFQFLQEWCGFGDFKSVLDERYDVMTRKAHESREHATTVAILELEKTTFQIATLSCMATLCSGTLKQPLTVPGQLAILSFDIKGVLNWVHETICSDVPKVQEIGKTALSNILTSNINNDEIFLEVLKECYKSKNSMTVRETYCTLVFNSFMTYRKDDEMPYEIFCVCLFLVGTDNYQIRYAAIKCMVYIEEKFLKTKDISAFMESACCSTVVVFKKVLFEISLKLAASHPESAFVYISYLTKYFNALDNATRRDISACLLPWVQTVQLKYVENELNTDDQDMLPPDSSQSDFDVPSLMVLNNLFEITVKLSGSISNEVEALWVALATNPQNYNYIFDYIIRGCLERKNMNFVSYSRQIVAYLVFSKPNSSYITDKLIHNLQPKAMVPLQSSTSRISEEKGDFPYNANLTQILSTNNKESGFSLGQLSMIFLVDLFRSKDDMVMKHLPLLLHVCFTLMDHYVPLVQEQAVSLLIHLVHSIAPNNQKSVQVMDSLRKKDNQSRLWSYDDLNNEKKGGITPKNMDLLVRNILELFTPISPNLQNEWGRISLKWATTCAVRHIACRSFQIFRSLLSFLDQTMLKDMLNRLSNTVADASHDIQGFAMQILMTLNAITAELDSQNLIDFPQLFWSSVACLNTIHEHEFIETISTMSKFVSKIDLDAQDTISCLIATFPPKWEGKFKGLQDVVLVGLRSATAWEPTFKFLDRLNKLKDSDIIGMGDQRLVTTLVANFPRFLHALDQNKIPSDIEETCYLISEMASARDKVALARILNSLAKGKFRSKKEFLVQTISSMRSSFFPEYESQVVILLLSFLFNKIPWVKIETLNILKHIFPLIDFQREEFTGLGADLISPLLRLLLTEYAESALEVLDEAVTISGSQLDNDILRMSMGNAAMRKEYQETATLFGIPDDSGWAIPMPAITSFRTRHNVHAVFATCGESAVVDEKQRDAFAQEDIQFLMEDYQAPSDHGDTASVGVEDPAPSLSNMWAALDDFDSFFTKPSDQRASLLPGKRAVNRHSHNLSADTKNSTSSDLTSPIDSVPQVYDKKALVILNRSLARTQSNTSFKNTFADSYGFNSNQDSQENGATKRSYLPFRSSRIAKNKNDSFTTPVLNSTNGFEKMGSSTPTKASLKSSPGTITNSLQSLQRSPLQTDNIQVSPDSTGSDGGIRFDQILGAGRKRNRKSLKEL